VKPVLQKNALIYIISTQDIKSIAELFQKAVQTRRNFVEDAVHLRGIIRVLELLSAAPVTE